MARASKQEEILDAAEKLFEAEGFVATGINTITTRAGVASMTLYNNFDSKQDLVVSTLKRRSERFNAALENVVQAEEINPKQSILEIFKAADQWVSSELSQADGFNGCYFLRASTEFGRPEHPAHIAAADHKKFLIGLFENALIRFGCKEAEEKALELHILFDGALMQAQMMKDIKSTKRAIAMAKRLLAEI